MKKIVASILILIMTINILAVSTYAEEKTKISANTIKENFEKLKKEIGIEKILINVKDVTENNLKIDYEGKDYNFNYESNPEKIIFSYKINMRKGMKYEEYSKQIEMINIATPILYTVIAMTKDVPAGDGYTLYSYALFMDMMEKYKEFTNSEEYLYIIDDTLKVTDVPEELPKNAILASRFGERAMEFADQAGNSKMTFEDKEYGTYKTYQEQLDRTEDKCVLETKLEVNIDKDFSKIKDFTERFIEKLLIKDITKENADYLVTIKKGQKCRIVSNQAITQKVFAGTSSESEDIDKNILEIEFEQKGKTNGYIISGKEKKTFYFTIEENEKNKEYEPKIINIEVEPGKFEEENTTNKVENEQKDTNKKPISKLPATGKQIDKRLILLYSTIIISSIGLIIIEVINKKNKR